MACEVYKALEKAWTDATKEFSEATSNMAANAGRLRIEEFNVLRATYEAARTNIRTARLQMTEHQNEPCCSPAAPLLLDAPSTSAPPTE